MDSSRSVEIKILNSNGQMIRHYSTLFKKEKLEENTSLGKLKELKEGMNHFVWDMRYPRAEGFPKIILWAGGLGGPMATPGEYRARLILEKDSFEKSFRLLPDPRSSATQEDHMRRFQAALEVNQLLTSTHRCIKDIRKARTQINSWNSKLDTGANKEIIDYSKALLKDMGNIEKALYQTKNQSPQDPLNFPIRLNDKLAGVGSNIRSSDGPPTKQALAVLQELSESIQKELDSWEAIKKDQIPKFNDLIQGASIEAVKLE